MKRYRARRYWRYQTQEDHRRRRSVRYRKRQTGTRRIISVIALILVVVGLGLVLRSLFLGEDSLVRRAVSTATESDQIAASAPKEKTLWLTVPKMARVEDLPVYDAPWDSEAALDASASHLDSSGFPWEDGANVYISGHRMGFPGTRSFLVFYDLDVLENDDEIFLSDSDGTKYTYKVFKKYVSDPYDWSATEPISGKNIVTLQTCTLPDYTQRLIVQAELVETTEGAESPHKEETAPQEETTSQEKATPQDIPPQEGLAPQDNIPQEEAAAPETLPQGETAPESATQGETTPEAVPPQGEVVPKAGGSPQQGGISQPIPQQEEIPPGAAPQQGAAAPGAAPQQGAAAPGAAPQQGAMPGAGLPQQGVAPPPAAPPPATP